YKAVFVFPLKTYRKQVSDRPLSFPFISSVPQSSPPLSLLLASILAVASLSTFWSNQLLAICSTVVVSSYSNSYELATVVVNY
ncbi:unnamed protein product, partial [Hymenolepis diminuta]